MLSDESSRIEAGAPERDMSSYSEWRESADSCIHDALRLYGTYLVGQTAGFSDALNLAAVVAAFDLEEIPADERPELARRMLMIHGAAMEVAKARQRKAKHG